MKKYPIHSGEEIVIIDFETTGLSPYNDRIIEVGAVIVKEKKVINSFSQLMNPGCYLPYFITDLTGISNSMLTDKPRPEKIMPKLKRFIGDRVILAHNASFDSKFLHSEMSRVNITINNPFLCTMLLSRRLIPDVYDYKLGTLANYFSIKIGKAHRALDDVKATAELWGHLNQIVCDATGTKQLDNHIFETISKKPKKLIAKYFEQVKSNNL